jgi:hypothetical protein
MLSNLRWPNARRETVVSWQSEQKNLQRNIEERRSLQEKDFMWIFAGSTLEKSKFDRLS